jgi:hypothetical protein
VDVVSTKIEDITEALAGRDYATKTKGERHLEGARPCGEGVYSIVEVFYFSTLFYYCHHQFL